MINAMKKSVKRSRLDSTSTPTSLTIRYIVSHFCRKIGLRIHLRSAQVYRLHSCSKISNNRGIQLKFISRIKWKVKKAISNVALSLMQKRLLII